MQCIRCLPRESKAIVTYKGHSLCKSCVSDVSKLEAKLEGKGLFKSEWDFKF